MNIRDRAICAKCRQSRRAVILPSRMYLFRGLFFYHIYIVSSARGAVLRFRPNDCKFVALLLAVRLAIFERSHTIVLFEQILKV